MPKWNLVSMGLTGRPEAQILSLISAGFLAIALIDFLREVDAVIAAERNGRQPANNAPAVSMPFST